MSKQNVSNFMKNIAMKVSRHSPEILTGLGVAGMLTSTVLAVKATPKALRLLDQKKYEEDTDKLSPVEVVKTAWKCYIPAAVTGAVSATCLIGASSAHIKRNAALATAYKISETALAEYREQVLETIGEKKEKTVRDKVSKKRIENNPVSKNSVVVTERGNTLCFDPISARYFKSDIDKIKKTENKLNKSMIHDMSGYVSLNEFYDELGLEETSIGHEIGWHVSRGLIDIDFSSHVTDDGQPCLVLDFVCPPIYEFSTFR